MAQGGVWNVMRDWQPLWETGRLESFMAAIIGFTVVTGITIILSVARGLSTRVAGKRKKSHPDGIPGVPVFDILLALVSIVMAFLSNRFIPVALLAISPLLARQLYWLSSFLRPGWTVSAGGYSLVLIIGIIVIADNAQTLDPRNPLQNTGGGTFFEKLHYEKATYDEELVRFINDNNIRGPVFSPWQWEGYLRWNAPKMKPFIGGRAQQVYDAQALRQYIFLSSGESGASYRGKEAKDVLNGLGAHYLITGNSTASWNLIYTALMGGNWEIVHADASFLLFANTDVPAAAQTVARFREGGLVFETEAIRAMSRAAHVLSRPDRWEEDDLAALFRQAWSRQPLWLWSYMMLFTHTQGSEELFGEVVTLLEEQLSRLEGMPLDNADAGDILECRAYIAESLANLAAYMKNPRLEDKRRKSMQEARQLWSVIAGRWKPLISN